MDIDLAGIAALRDELAAAELAVKEVRRRLHLAVESTAIRDGKPIPEEEVPFGAIEAIAEASGYAREHVRRLRRAAEERAGALEPEEPEEPAEPAKRHAA